MGINVKQHLIFPTLIHEIELPLFKEVEKDLIKFVYQERKDNPKGVAHSNIGGWPSPSTPMTSGNIVHDTIKNYLSEYFSSKHSLIEGTKIDVTSLWNNINKKNNYNMMHTHPGSHLAGVFWIKTPDNCGCINFNSYSSHERFEELSCYNEEYKESTGMYPGYSYAAVAGRMLLFPASLMHQVYANKSNQDRISSSFNIRLIKP